MAGAATKTTDATAHEAGGIVAGMTGDGIACITLAAPPANLIDARLVAALAAAFDAALRDGARAVLILGDGAWFSAGAGPDHVAPPALAPLLARIEGAALPVIAAPGGPAAGAGASLALAAHLRLAAPRAWFSWPEARMGLLPAAGAAARLARVVGAGPALALLQGAARIPAAEADRIGLVDAVIAGADPAAFAASALSRVRALLGAGIAPVAACARPVDGWAAMQAVQAARGAPGAPGAGPGASPPLVAPARLIDCVEAAFLLPWERALTFCAEAEADAAADPAGRALRHLAGAERALGPAFTQRDAQGRLTLSPRGLGVAGALRAAWVMAAQALVRAGAAPAAVDGAARAYGHEAGPLDSDAPARADPGLARRLLAALVAEAARLIDSGRIDGPEQADALAVMATGFPRARGGPVHAAQESGLAALVLEMAPWAELDPVWEVPAPLARAALAGGRWERRAPPLSPEGRRPPPP
ncbi:MAG: enoyl-CoA hydratase/isomerase family protein [Rubellimicrobium sp.]|nr:enoyl-CoA hydratase/isomerase family protein [Rubellimicrobium sp.]